MSFTCPYCGLRADRGTMHAHLAGVHGDQITFSLHERSGYTLATVTCPLCSASWEQPIRKARRDPRFLEEYAYEIRLVLFDLLLHHLRGEHGEGGGEQ
uniref:Uncharacterized protein n=1 Tax=Thermomicrobium roseum TaxID=500 RepID=A0A7C5VU41_THERO